MSTLEFAKIEIKETNAGTVIKASNVTSCRGERQFAYDLAAKLGIKTFHVDDGFFNTMLIVEASWINGKYHERTIFDVSYDYSEKCFYVMEEL